MLRGRSSKAMGVALWLTLAVVSTVAPARAQSFSQGKALALIVGNTAGSLPGRPNIITQNMPGALVDPLATDPTKYRYEASKFEYIGTADSGTRVCFTSARSGVNYSVGIFVSMIGVVTPFT